MAQTASFPAELTSPSASLHPLIANRWSPRAFDPGHEMDDGQIVSLIEAARWASSASNVQPWRFLVGRRGDDTFTALLDTLMPGNQLWAAQASLLVLAVAEERAPDGKEQRWAQYDLGQAVAQMVLQAEALGLHVHQMGGFRADELRAVLAIGERFTPVVVMAVGALGDVNELPAPLQEREHAPRRRRAVEEVAGTRTLPQD